MQRLVREGVAGCLEKCLEDNSVNGWRADTHQDILDACLWLGALTNRKLQAGLF